MAHGGSKDKPYRFRTQMIHAGHGPDPLHGAVMMPIYQTSTFAFEDVLKPGEFDYTRSGNPTRKALEDCLAALEGGTRGFVTGTGMSAEATFLAMFGPGDHLIIHDDLYGGTYRLLVNVIATKGVEISFVNLRDLDALKNALKKETRCIWIETPTNPLMNLIDLAAVAEIAKNAGVYTICDNTFLTPYFQRPLDLGIDVSLHSTTKYINGHSDVVGGALITKHPQLAEKIGYLQNAIGTAQGPFECFLVLRGLKTLAIRMDAHNENALTIAQWLEDHPKVSQVMHPGLKSHPQYDLGQKQMTGFGGTFSFRVKGSREEIFTFLRGLKIFTLAESLGGVESLIDHAATMTHLSMPEDVRNRVGITDDLIRLSVGLEDVQDLIADLDQALSQA
ncbi:MAG: cystathionine beta-lyase [Candidatus Hydrogenedentota bacterium]